MRIIVDGSGLDEWIARFTTARAALPSLLQEAVQTVGEQVSQELSQAAPKGANPGPPPPGDGDGLLSESFYTATESISSASVSVSVNTTQPIKLRYVRCGRGEVRPVAKRALFWNGLPHPVMYAKPTQPNEFVQPVLDASDATVSDALTNVIDELNGML